MTDVRDHDAGDALRDDVLRAELIRIVYRHQSSVLVNPLLASLVTAMVWSRVPHLTAVVWLTLVSVTTVARGALWLTYRSRQPPPRESRAWASAFVAGLWTSAAVWGSAALLLLPSVGIAERLGVTVTVVGLAAGITASASAYLPAIYGFLAFSLLPYVAAFLGAGTFFDVLVAVLIGVYAGGTALVARNNAGMIRELIVLRLEVARQSEAVARANVAKSKFLAAASHDLRQPLHALTLFMAALDERFPEGEPRQILGQAQASLTAMRSLFDALLDVSRLDAGIVEPHVQAFELQLLLDRLASEFAPQAEGKGLRWVQRGDGGVVRSDPVLLERILRNLLSNAVRYTPSGEISLECAARDDGAVAVTVRDTGIGIPQDRQQEVFLEFHQLGNPERDRTQGLGLGLAIVDRLVRLLGHELAVESELARGTTMTVVVPAGERDEVPPRASVAAGSSSDLEGLRVLVIDDDKSVREAMARLLETWGCVVTLAASEDEAVSAATGVDGAPDVVVADYRLRDGLVGTDVLERLWRELGRRLPALLVTGDTAPERLREAGASGHALLHKPVPPARLRAFLRHTRRVGGTAGA